jgi:SAM-dependent methyltransferase
MEIEKQLVQDFWNAASCGERLFLSMPDLSGYEAQASVRYALEPYILSFGRFSEAAGKRVLEIGVGLGADHQRFVEAGADAFGIDLTPRAVAHTRDRLNAFGLPGRVAVGDAERLSFKSDYFDVVYSWGVLHHSPDTAKAVKEVWRVLRHGGQARIMIYHKWSIVGFMLWMRYALLALRPWRTLRELYSNHLESPGTKAYSRSEALALFSQFASVRITTVLTHGDLLESEAGQRHRGLLLSTARRVWPRRLIRRLLPGSGLFMLIEATK